MGEDPEETLREIEETREALGEKVDALVGQVREKADAARRNGLRIAGILAAAAVGLITVKKLRNRR